MNQSEDTSENLMTQTDRDCIRNKIQKRKGGKNPIFDQDIHCNLQQVVLQIMQQFSQIHKAKEAGLVV